MENIIANKNIKERKKFSISRVFVYGTLILYTLFLFVPFYTVIVTAFTDHVELTSSATFIWWPKNFSLQGFKNLIEYDDMYLMTGVPSIVRGFINTIWMSTLPTIVGLFFSGLAAYVYILGTQRMEMELASVVSIVLFVVTLTLSVIIMKKRNEKVEG